MCGLTGFFCGQRSGDEAATSLKCMTDAIAHRGSDVDGQWQDSDAGVALGHRRLSVVDLSSAVDALYLGLVSHWDDPASVVIGATEPPTLLTANAPQLSGLDDIQRMMALDTLTYLPDDIFGEGGPSRHGRLAGGARAVSGSPGGGICLELAAIHEAA